MECCEINLSAAENKRGAGVGREGRGGASEPNLPSYKLTVKASVAEDVPPLGQEERRSTCHVFLMSLGTRGCTFFI